MTAWFIYFAFGLVAGLLIAWYLADIISDGYILISKSRYYDYLALKIKEDWKKQNRGKP
jgi:hypothetical protein